MSGASEASRSNHNRVEAAAPLDAALANSFDPTELSPSDTWTEIGDGGYSEVYKASLLGTPVAVKQATSRKKSSGEALLREMRFLRMIGPHPNIVLPYGSFVDNGQVHLWDSGAGI